MNQNLGFDPLLFLGITNLKDEERDRVSQELLDKIARYIAGRIAELLSADDLKVVDDDPEKLFTVAKDKIPDFNNKMKMFLDDYKKEYYQNLKIVKSYG